jgi:hypothetical protein
MDVDPDAIRFLKNSRLCHESCRSVASEAANFVAFAQDFVAVRHGWQSSPRNFVATCHEIPGAAVRRSAVFALRSLSGMPTTRRPYARAAERSGALPANYTEDLGRESFGLNGLREDPSKWRFGQVIVRFVASEGDDGNGASAHFDLIDQPPTIPTRHRQIRHDHVTHHHLRQSFKGRGCGQHEGTRQCEVCVQ